MKFTRSIIIGALFFFLLFFLTPHKSYAQYPGCCSQSYECPSEQACDIPNGACDSGYSCDPNSGYTPPPAQTRTPDITQEPPASTTPPASTLSCGTNEHPSEDGTYCVCDSGYQINSTTGICESTTPSPSAQTCGSPQYRYTTCTSCNYGYSVLKDACGQISYGDNEFTTQCSSYNCPVEAPPPPPALPPPPPEPLPVPPSASTLNCGANEQPSSDGTFCVCSPGFQINSTTGICESTAPSISCGIAQYETTVCTSCNYGYPVLRDACGNESNGNTEFTTQCSNYNCNPAPPPPPPTVSICNDSCDNYPSARAAACTYDQAVTICPGTTQEQICYGTKDCTIQPPPPPTQTASTTTQTSTTPTFSAYTGVVDDSQSQAQAINNSAAATTQAIVSGQQPLADARAAQDAGLPIPQPTPTPTPTPNGPLNPYLSLGPTSRNCEDEPNAPGCNEASPPPQVTQAPPTPSPSSEESPLPTVEPSPSSEEIPSPSPSETPPNLPGPGGGPQTPSIPVLSGIGGFFANILPFGNSTTPAADPQIQALQAKLQADDATYQQALNDPQNNAEAINQLKATLELPDDASNDTVTQKYKDVMAGLGVKVDGDLGGNFSITTSDVNPWLIDPNTGCVITDQACEQGLQQANLDILKKLVTLIPFEHVAAKSNDQLSQRQALVDEGKNLGILENNPDLAQKVRVNLRSYTGTGAAPLTDEELKDLGLLIPQVIQDDINEHPSSDPNDPRIAYLQKVQYWNQNGNAIAAEATADTVAQIAGGPALKKGLEVAQAGVEKVTAKSAADELAAAEGKPIWQKAGDFFGGLFGKKAEPIPEPEPVYVAATNGSSQEAGQVVSDIVTSTARSELPPLDNYSAEQLVNAQETASLVFGTDNLGEKELQIAARWNQNGVNINNVLAAKKEVDTALAATRSTGITSESLNNLTDILSIQEGMFPGLMNLDKTDASSSVYSFLVDAVASKKANDIALKPVLGEAKDGLTLMKKYAIEQGVPNTEKVAQVDIDKIVDPNKIYETSPDVIRRSPGSDAVGVYESVTNAVLLDNTYNGGLDFRVICHELCHRAQSLGDYRKFDISELLGVDIVHGLSNETTLSEGITENLAQFVQVKSGKATDFLYKSGQGSYPEEVKMIQEKIVPAIQKNLNLTYDQANAYTIATGLTGDYKTLIEAAGGPKFVKRILDETNITSHTTTNGVGIGTTLGGFAGGAGLALTALAAADTSVNQDLNNQQNQNNNTNSQLLPFHIVPAVLAANSNNQSATINSKQFDLLVKKELIKSQLKQTGKIDSQFVKDVLQSNLLDSLATPFKSGYLLVTGRTGNVSAGVSSGIYKISTNPIPGIDITVNSLIDTSKIKTIKVQIKKGSGKVIYTKAQPSLWARLLNLFHIPVARAADASSSAKINSPTTSTSKVQVVVIDDKTKKVLPWAGVNVELKKAEQETPVILNQGWNLITLPLLPDIPLTASDLLFEITKDGGNASTVSTLENGTWKSYVVRDNKDFSQENFAIKPGSAYFVKALKKSVLVLKGQELVAPVKLDLKAGWNSFGIPFSKVNYSASSLIDKLATPSGADSVSSWNSGLWDTFLKKLNQAFGSNFTIEKNKGYILNVGKNSQFTP